MEVGQQTFAQKKPDQLVYLELGSGNGGMLLSISQEGFRFRAVSGIRPDGTFPFAFSLDGSHRLQGIGEIAWLESDGKSGGMRFVDVSSEFRDALDKWLAAGPRHRDSGREATPAAATPLDTMEKIREELRRGYPTRPVEPRPDSKEVAPQPPVPPPSRTAPVKTKTTSPAQAAHKVQSVPPAETQMPKFSASAVPTPRPQDLFKRPVAKVSDPPVKQEDPSTKPSSSILGGSAFLKIPRADVADPAPDPPPPQAATQPSTLHTFTLTDSGDITPSSRPSAPQRPYIPAPEASYDSAWEHAQLTVPQEPPHLSRAAAGSIIGLALLVILGALAFNFRQDIGTMIIDVGQKISGQDHAAPPTTSASSPSPTDTSLSASSDSQNSAAKKDESPAPSATSSLDSSNSASSNNAASPQPNPATSETNAATKKLPKPGLERAATSERPSAANVASVPKAVEQPPVSTEPTDNGSGQEEFNAARDILRGPSRQRDLQRAVELLWSAVRKGYVPAEVTLGDLYRRGDGVEKSCDQAQVLLVAASKKGSPDARRILEFMAEHGCE